MQLNQRAYALINQYVAGLAASYNVADTSRYFSLTDPKETTLRDALLHSAEFLQMITVMDVDQLQGQVVAVGNPGLFTGRKKEGRFTKRVGVDGNEYKLVETDSCAQLTFALLSVWANAGSENEFFQRVTDFSNNSFALDMIRIGFNGTSIAVDSDPVANPNGEDVNRGWHTIVKERSPNQIVTDPIVLGANGDYKSLDAMASDLINTKIGEPFRQEPNLIVLCGADLVAAEEFRLYNAADRPTEKNAAQLLSQSIAGRRAFVPPYMPGKRMIVTTPSNLHIYTQRGTRQRKSEWVDDRKAFENKYLRNEGYAVEYDELYAAFDENAVTISDEPQP
ncbi:TPA: phage major capsid protein, P2 family [Serratia fonticola]